MPENKHYQLSKLIYFIITLVTFALFSAECRLLMGALVFDQAADYMVDEVNFYKAASEYNPIIGGMALGYGFLFWYISAFVIQVLKFDTETNLLILRVFFLALKYASFIIVALTVKRLTCSRCAILGFVILLLTPAYYFYGKIFSPEYLITFLVALSVYLLVVDNGKMSKFFYISVFVAISAFAVKFTIVPFGLLYISYIAHNYKLLNIKRTILVIIAALVINFFPFLIGANPDSLINVLHSGSTNFTLTLMNLEVWLFFKLTTWDEIPLGGLLIDYTPVFICILTFITFSFLNFNEQVDDTKKYKKIFSAYLFFTGFVMLAFICLQSTIFFWYLFPSYLLIICGLIGLLGSLPALTASIIILLFLTPPRINWRMNDRAFHNVRLAENYAASDELNDFILNKYPEGGIALCDINVAYKATDPVETILVKDALSARDLSKSIGKKVELMYKIDKAKFLIINKQLQKSQLIEQFYKGKIPTEFNLIGKFKSFEIYVKK